MATYLKLDKSLYGIEGTIPLKRGDRWELFGKVVNKYAGFEYAKNMTGRSATAFFEGETETQAILVEVLDPAKGTFQVDVPASTTPAMALSEENSFYIVTDEDETYETIDEPLEVKDRGFGD